MRRNIGAGYPGIATFAAVNPVSRAYLLKSNENFRSRDKQHSLHGFSSVPWSSPAALYFKRSGIESGHDYRSQWK
jgi:hypothetical protein